MAEAVASGTLPIAMTNTRLLTSISMERLICKNGRRVRSNAPSIFRQEHGQHEDQVAGEARPGDLRCRVVGCEQLHCGIHERKGRDACAHQQDAAQDVRHASERASEIAEHQMLREQKSELI